MNLRRTKLVLVSCVASGLAAAQPPVPLAVPPASAGAIVAAPTPRANPSLAEKSDRVARLESELRGLRARESETRATLRSRARALYRIRRGGGLPREGGFEALLARRGRLERLEQVILDDNRRLADFAGRVRAADEALAAAKRDAEAEARRVDLEEAARQAIDEQLGGGGAAYASLPALDVVPMPDAPVVASGAGNAPIVVENPSGFGALRGRLGMPVTTSIGMRDAVRDDGPGVEFVARAGTAVMSVAPGRVAFAGDYGSYGRMIILDHGDTFYTIYAGLGRIAVRVGDWIERGGLLAEVGGAAHGSPALFFEVRRGTRSLDTRNWIGVTR